MSTQKHTPEPWKYHKAPHVNGGNIHIIQAGELRGMTVATIVAGIEKGNSDRIDPICEANTRRIVACVNACAGIDTLQLEILDVKTTIDGAHVLIKQRNELLLALKGVVDWCGQRDDIAGELLPTEQQGHYIAEAMRLIAKVEAA